MPQLPPRYFFGNNKHLCTRVFALWNRELLRAWAHCIGGWVRFIRHAHMNTRIIVLCLVIRCMNWNWAYLLTFALDSFAVSEILKANGCHNAVESFANGAWPVYLDHCYFANCSSENCCFLNGAFREEYKEPTTLYLIVNILTRGRYIQSPMMAIFQRSPLKCTRGTG